MWPFKRDKRLIFRFWDGCRSHAVDPLKIVLELAAHKTFDCGKFGDALAAQDAPAILEGVQTIRQVFAIPEWTETTPGLNTAEVVKLFDDFILYNEALKKNTKPPPTLPPATESTSIESTTKPATACT